MRGRSSFQLAHTSLVRRSELSAKSLIWNILRLTLLDPIFCKDKSISPEYNSPEINILRAPVQKSPICPQPLIRTSTTRNPETHLLEASSHVAPRTLTTASQLLPFEYFACKLSEINILREQNRSRVDNLHDFNILPLVIQTSEMSIRANSHRVICST